MEIVVENSSERIYDNYRDNDDLNNIVLEMRIIVSND